MGAGKSGSFFFYSHDSKLIIKTINTEEKALFNRILENLNKHIVENTQNNSILARIYGLYSIKSSQFNKVSFILM